jgi:hypothetical protein
MAPVRKPPVVEQHAGSLLDRACVRCGYGVAAGRAPERCPMCGGTDWRLRTLAAGADRPRLQPRVLPEDALPDVFLP